MRKDCCFIVGGGRRGGTRGIIVVDGSDENFVEQQSVNTYRFEQKESL